MVLREIFILRRAENDRKGKDKWCGSHGLSGIALTSSDLKDISQSGASCI